ncbi:potassium channel family protein [Nocardiopsis sp. NPDC058631]|uniref:potassium channel family protein n=1 Tax=Nocardiopsis sp. NPDC058631 TaxID=3346566 RepID=UPI00365B2D2B
MRRRGPLEGRPVNLGSFLAFVVLLQFGYPVTFHGAGWTALYLVAYVGVVLFGVLLVRGEHDRVAPAAVAGTALLLCAGWAGASGGDGTAMVCVFVTAGAFQVMIVSSLLRFVYRRSRTHELELVLAGVCVYLLLGGFFTAVFGALESASPGSFTDRADPGGQVAWQQLTYFSYVTLATLGYGDVVPVSPWARTAATAEAVTGTLFLITIVGRLVGAYIGVRPGRDGERGAP